jgi:hypothetical protein
MGDDVFYVPEERGWKGSRDFIPDSEAHRPIVVNPEYVKFHGRTTQCPASSLVGEWFQFRLGTLSDKRVSLDMSQI